VEEVKEVVEEPVIKEEPPKFKMNDYMEKA